MEKITHPYIRKSVFSGVLDRNLRKLENRLGVNLSIRGDSLIVEGLPKKVEFAKRYFEKMSELEERGCTLREEDFHIALDLLEGGNSQALDSY
ncbi:MAG: phosphate starvation-inducible protein PhoH, partial [Candidatus Aminicenantes bacterium]|nr:phosphate starvation-inducible protein PhoH [Candidatus Aminicenantes bacterium]